jgi:fermentation-respiration switch protein FrsA (DUF1100 family)
MVVLLIFLIAGLFFLIASYIFAAKVFYPKRFGVEETYEIEKKNGRIEEGIFNTWKKEEVILQSPFGYRIFGLYFPAMGSRKTVILSHGITYTLYGSVKYMKMFMDLGFNIFIYDNRFHGRSGGPNATLGFFEKYDLKRITDWVEEKIGVGSIIGTHGESMGAAISLQHAAIDPRIKFVIEDCSFDRLDTLLAHRLKKDYHLPRYPVLPMVELISKLFTGMVIKDVSPEDAVTLITSPILFIHGDKDEFIPVEMVEKLAALKINGPKNLYIASNAGHAESFWTDQKQYITVVNDFLHSNKLV